MAPTRREPELVVSPRGFFGFVRGIGLMILYILQAGEKPPPKKWVYKCRCGRRYQTHAAALYCDHAIRESESE